MNAPRDNNFVPVKLATSNADGVTVLPLKADPSTHRLKVSNGTSGSNLSSNNIAKRDQNRVTAILAVSSSDGITPTQIYIDSSTNSLLITTT